MQIGFLLFVSFFLETNKLCESYRDVKANSDSFISVFMFLVLTILYFNVSW
jgi:hypothetical protein